MKKLRIFWANELKKSVPFDVYINGMRTAVIERGDDCFFNVPDDRVELYFVPKAPKWFGWKALKITTELQEELPELYIGVTMPKFSLLGELGRAANPNNQLHGIASKGLNVIDITYIKKY